MKTFLFEIEAPIQTRLIEAETMEEARMKLVETQEFPSDYYISDGKEISYT